MANFSLVPTGHGVNYTGMLTRSIVFTGALAVFLAATGITIASIIVPEWISYDTTTVSCLQKQPERMLTSTGPRNRTPLESRLAPTMFKYESPSQFRPPLYQLEDGMR